MLKLCIYINAYSRFYNAMQMTNSLCAWLFWEFLLVIFYIYLSYIIYYNIYTCCNLNTPSERLGIYYSGNF